MADDSELVSLGNKLFDVERWSQVGTPQTRTIDSADAAETYRVNILKITTSHGSKRLLVYWYELPNSVGHSRINTKLSQTFDVLLGERGAGALVAISMPFNASNEDKVAKQLNTIVSTHADKIKASLPF